MIDTIFTLQLPWHKGAVFFDPEMLYHVDSYELILRYPPNKKGFAFTLAIV